MDFIKVQEEYSWVVSVLESCESENQVEVSKNLFKQYLIKWSHEISEERKTRLSHIFGKLTTSKVLEIRKNRLQSI